MTRLPFSSSDFLSLFTPVKSIVSLKALSARLGSVPVVLPALFCDEQAVSTKILARSSVNSRDSFLFMNYLLIIFSFF